MSARNKVNAACPASMPAPVSPKREAIAKAAKRVFLRDGYGGASMDAIAREAQVSKATLYTHFQGKDDLFAAIVQENCRQMMVDIESAMAAGHGPREVLTAVGLKFLKRMMSDEIMALYRILVAEAYRFPVLGRAVNEGGPEPSCNGLADYFRAQTDAGTLAVADPDVAADQFFGAVMGGIHFRRLIGVGKAASAAEIAHRVDCAVESFLAAHVPAAHDSAARHLPAEKARRSA